VKDGAERAFQEIERRGVRFIGTKRRPLQESDHYKASQGAAEE
jgi:hypothetical protein